MLKWKQNFKLLPAAEGEGVKYKLLSREHKTIERKDCSEEKLTGLIWKNI